MCARHVTFFFNDTATTEIYTLSLHDALPILTATSSADAERTLPPSVPAAAPASELTWPKAPKSTFAIERSEEHTSELQSQFHLVCRLLLEKKKEDISTFRLVFN